jgi:hypothetical protein
MTMLMEIEMQVHECKHLLNSFDCSCEFCVLFEKTDMLSPIIDIRE